MKLKKRLSIILALAMLAGVLGCIPAYAKDLTIKDIKPEDEAYSIAQWVVDQGYMSLTLGKFLPAKYVKRSEFAAIVTKLNGSNTALLNPKTPTFQDVTTKNQFYKQIETAKTYMTSYKSKTAKLFKPESYITREDTMMSIIKVLGYDCDEAIGSNDNSDLSLDDIIDDADKVNPVLVKYVAIGVSNELMDLRTVGEKCYFDPKKNITRRDLAVLIYNAFDRKNYTAEEEEDSAANIDNNEDTDAGDSSSTSADYQTGPLEEGAIDLSWVYPGITGTVKKLDDPAAIVNIERDCVVVTKVTPATALKAGVKTNLTVEVEYSLTTKDKAILGICFNVGGGDFGSPNTALEVVIWDVAKGTGKYRFTFPITPKNQDISSHWVMGHLREDGGRNIMNTMPIYLKK